MSGRDGVVSLGELVLVLWLSSLLLLGFSGFLFRQGRLGAGQRDLIRFQEARRVSQVVLGGELRSLGPADARIVADDALRLRAVRGGGAICRTDGDELELDYAGVRQPDPRKDSIILLAGPGEETRALTAVSGPAACGPHGLRIVLDRATDEAPAFALVFEAGAYQAVGGALRYATGAGGRQPLTEEVFGDAHLEALTDRRGYRLTLGVHPDSLARAPRTLRVTAAVLNGTRVDDR